jgi:isocitrate lyase
MTVGVGHDWKTSDRWRGIVRPYRAADVERLRGSIQVEHTLGRLGAQRLWRLLESEPFVPTLGAMTGTQAVQMVAAGLPAIYASGWQVAADANNADQTYPDQSLYPADSMPALVRRLNNAFRREDEKQHASGKEEVYWYAPIVADAEAGFGGTLNVFEITKGLIEAGAAGLHLEDQLASVKKCGHMGGKVLVPAREFNQKLWAARLAADILGVPTLLVARTDALSAKLLTSDIDPRDAPFLTGRRTPEGFYEVTGGLDMAIARSLAYAPYADLLWFETSSPDVDEAERFAREIHREFPGKRLAYNCSPSFNWRKKLSPEVIATFQSTIAEMGYKFQFVTLAGFHVLNLATFRLARGYAQSGMAAYSDLQEEEFRAVDEGYAAVKHQSFVGASYFDDISQVLSGGLTTTLAMDGSTEEEQFARKGKAPAPTASPRARGRSTAEVD